MVDKSEKEESPSRAGVISAVTTYLGFFTLLVIAVEASLGAIALKTSGRTQLVVVAALIGLFAAVLVIVAFFAYRKPEILLRRIGESLATNDFCKALCGWWWETPSPAPSAQHQDGLATAISFVEIQLDKLNRAVIVKGESYAENGEQTAHWSSSGASVDENAKRMFYYWTGLELDKPNEPYEGIGVLSFHSPNESEPKQLESAEGYFVEINSTKADEWKKKVVTFRRSSKDDVSVMLGVDDRKKSELVCTKVPRRRQAKENSPAAAEKPELAGAGSRVGP